MLSQCQTFYFHEGLFLFHFFPFLPSQSFLSVLIVRTPALFHFPLSFQHSDQTPCVPLCSVMSLLSYLPPCSHIHPIHHSFSHFLSPSLPPSPTHSLPPPSLFHPLLPSLVHLLTNPIHPSFTHITPSLPPSLPPVHSLTTLVLFLEGNDLLIATCTEDLYKSALICAQTLHGTKARTLGYAAILLCMYPLYFHRKCMDV